MLKGTLYITYDPNLCLANLNTCKIITVLDDSEMEMYNIPGKIGGSILMPPYEALASIIDGDDEKFRYEYINYLNTNITVNKFVNIILQALIAGTNIILLLDPEGPKFDMVLKEYFMVSFGIIIGDSSNQFQWNITYMPIILNKLYMEDDIDCKYFLKLYPQEINLDQLILRKLSFDFNIEYTNDFLMNNYFKKLSKIYKNGGKVQNVVKRLGD